MGAHCLARTLCLAQGLLGIHKQSESFLSMSNSLLKGTMPRSFC